MENKLLTKHSRAGKKRRGECFIIFLAFTIFLAPSLSFSKTLQDNKLMSVTYKSEEAKEFFDKGMELFNKNQENESYEYFKKASEIDSTFALAFAFKGRLHPSFEGKKKNIAHALRLSTNATEGERILISALNAFYVTDENDKEYMFYKQLVEKYPADPLVRYFWGFANWRHGRSNYQLAEEELKKAIALDHRLAAAYNDLGYVLSELKKYNEAKNMFMKYIELTEGNVNAYDSYAEVLFKIGNYEESLEAYKKALEVDANFFWSNLGLAVNLSYLNRFEEAKEIVAKLRDKAKNQRESRHAKTAILIFFIASNDLEGAISEIIKQYIEAEDKNHIGGMYRALVRWGDILSDRGNPDEAIIKYNEAEKTIQNSGLRLETKNRVSEQILFKKIRANLEGKKITEARKKITYLEKLISGNSKGNLLTYLHEFKARLAFEEGDYEKAIEQIDKTNETFTNIYTKALFLKKMGKRNEALKLFCDVLNYNLLNDFDYSLVRRKAREILKTL